MKTILKTITTAALVAAASIAIAPVAAHAITYAEAKQQSIPAAEALLESVGLDKLAINLGGSLAVRAMDMDIMKKVEQLSILKCKIYANEGTSLTKEQFFLAAQAEVIEAIGKIDTSDSIAPELMKGHALRIAFMHHNTVRLCPQHFAW